MAVIRCRVCRLPFTEAEAPAGICASCAPVPEVVAPPPVPVPEQPGPMPAAVSSGKGWLVAAGALVIAAGVIVWSLTRDGGESDELPALRAAKESAETQARDAQTALARAKSDQQQAEERLASVEALGKRASLDKAAAEEAARAAAETLEKARLDQLALQEELVATRQATHPKPAPTARLENLPPPPAAQVAQPERPNRVPPPRVAEVPRERVPDVQAVAVQAPDAEGFELVRLDRPAEAHNLPPLNNGTKIKLVGRVRTLRIEGLNGGSALDASELKADEIELTGNVNAGAQVRLNAPGGTVRIPDINGDSWVQIDAPDGKVTVGHVNGQANVTITAKEVEFRESITGPGSRVAVTLSRAGWLKYKEIQGGARVSLKKSSPRDPEPRIEAGKVRDGSEFRRVK